MSESWKNRLWSLLLVCTFAFVLSVCNKALDSSSDWSSSSGTAFADGSTVTISSLPAVSFASNQVAISSQALPTISALMICGKAGATSRTFSSGVYTFSFCGSTYDTSLSGSNYTITLGNIIAAGFRPCGQHTSGHTSMYEETFFFCK